MKFKRGFGVRALVILGILVLMILTALMNWESIQHRYMPADMWPIANFCKLSKKPNVETPKPETKPSTRE